MKTAHQKLAAATILVLFAVLPLSGAEPLRLANSFGRSMVLQRDMPVPVWGWAPTQAEVAVTFKDQHKTTHADADGRWRVVFEPMSADATPSILTVSCATETVKAENILVGDVWLCAGPGLMRNIGALQNPKPEIAKARFPRVRLLRPNVYSSIVPVADIPPPADWTAVSPGSIEKYSITWYFGRDLHSASGVPVGVVLANMATDLPSDWLAWRYDPKDKGQAAALHFLAEQMPHDIARSEAWLFNMQRRQSGGPIDLLLFPSYIPYAFYNRHPVFGESYPISYRRSSVYNALIGPLVPMALRGVVLNCEFGSKHDSVAPGAIKELVDSWRAAWGRPGFPFVISEPVGKHERSGPISTAVSNAAALPNVAIVPRPAEFSELKSQDYWKVVAAVAWKLPKEKAFLPPPASAWAQPSPVKMDSPPARRRLEAAHLFDDNMVLQCDQPLKVWGWAEAGEKVTVSFAGQAKVATADAGGRWQATLDALKASDSPRRMTIQGKTDTLTFANALVGEVWINSGQSNSGYVMSATLGFAEEQPLANYPAIRYFANAQRRRCVAATPKHRQMGAGQPGDGRPLFRDGLLFRPRHP